MTDGEFRQFLGHAQGSNYELQTQIEVARRLKFAPEEQLKNLEVLSVEVAKMLSALIAKFTNKPRRQ